MIKHGKVHLLKGANAASHLDPIREFVTKGIADSRETITLDVRKCDVAGAKRYSGQQCVIAKALNRLLKPEAVAVGRRLTYAVFDGLAIRFRTTDSAKELAEEWDARGRAHLRPVKLGAINPTWRLGTKQRGKNKPNAAGGKRPRTRKINVRAVGGGVTYA